MSGRTFEDRVAVMYSGDPGASRRKHCGLTLLDQLILSVRSLREVWSSSVEIRFVHTEPLPLTSGNLLKQLGVLTFRAKNTLCPDFPMANKILVSDYHPSGKDLLFLDCDTRFHSPLNVEASGDLYVAYDVLQCVSKQTWYAFLNYFELKIPVGDVLRTPAAAYYTHGNIRQFPQLNSGVFLLRAVHVQPFYTEWKRIFMEAWQKFGKRRWRFYIEQLAFVAAIISLQLKPEIFQPGVNFICTPRAPSLSHWPVDRIVLEHYAGDTSQPLAFKAGRIDAVAIGL